MTPDPARGGAGTGVLSARALREHLEAAAEVVEAAGPLALRHFRSAVAVDDKSGGGRFDPVTRADREVEAFVRAELERRFPGYGILGEEQGLAPGTSPLRWVLDPIDGTRAFISGMPAWGILLGLSDDSGPLVGVMHQPFLGETFLGDGRGAFLRAGGVETPLACRGTTALAEAVLYCTHPDVFSPEELVAFERAAGACRMARYGGDCYAYCLVALGQVDLVIEASLQPYDIAPLVPILEAAGAVVTDWRGAPAHEGGRVLVAATPALHEAALARLRGDD